MIAETYELVASNTDVLAAPSRLAALPYAGVLVIEMQASTWDAANFWSVTIQLPDGSTPLDGFNPPDGATPGALNMDDKYTVSFPVTQGGHITIDCTETGTSLLYLRCTLTP